MLIVIVFFLLMIAEIIAFIIIRKKLIKNGTKKIYRIITVPAFIIALIVTIKFMVFPPIKELPTTGNYQITSFDYWIDEDITDIYSDSGQKRELQIRKWHPVNADDNLPIIIASHGSCGTIDNNVTLYRELASHGYTVLVVCHSGQSVRITYRDGKSAGPSMTFLKQMSALQPQKNPEQAYEIFSEWMDIRTADLKAVMDDYEDNYGAAEYVMLGHSLGGSAAYAMARIRDDVIGCIALEAPCMYDIKGTSNGEFVFDENDYDVPLLNIYSDSSYDHLHEWGQYRNNAMFIDGGNPLYTNIYYKGIGHMGLCDLSIASPLLSSVLSGEFQKAAAYDQLEILNKDCLRWLDTLK